MFYCSGKGTACICYTGQSPSLSGTYQNLTYTSGTSFSNTTASNSLLLIVYPKTSSGTCNIVGSATHQANVFKITNGQVTDGAYTENKTTDSISYSDCDMIAVHLTRSSAINYTVTVTDS